jgi:hypothetical protein
VKTGASEKLISRRFSYPSNPIAETGGGAAAATCRTAIVSEQDDRQPGEEDRKWFLEIFWSLESS